MKKIILSLAAILGCACSNSEAMTTAAIATAKNLEKSFNAFVAGGGKIEEFPNKVNTESLFNNFPKAKAAISADVVNNLYTVEAEKYINSWVPSGQINRWADMSIEELLSTVDSTSDALKTSNPIDPPYDDNSVGKLFYRTNIWGYYLGDKSLYGNLGDVLNTIKDFDFTAATGEANKKIRDTNAAVEAIVTAITTAGVEAATKEAVARAVVAAVVENGEITAEAIGTAAQNAANTAGDAAHAVAIGVVVQTAATNAGAPKNAIDGIRNAADLTNIHRLILMGTMYAVANGKGIPGTRVNAAGADGTHPLIVALPAAGHVAPWTYGEGGPTADQRDLAMQNYLQIAKTLMPSGN